MAYSPQYPHCIHLDPDSYLQVPPYLKNQLHAWSDDVDRRDPAFITFRYHPDKFHKFMHLCKLLMLQNITVWATKTVVQGGAA